MNRIANFLIVAGLAVLPGCVNPDSWCKSCFGTFGPETPPIGHPHQVKAMWENRIVVNEDSVNQGAKLFGLSGRVWFFGEKIGLPLAAHGTLTVFASEILPDGKTVPIEGWEIDSATLQRLCHKDIIGWGYTLYLPFKNVPRPDLKRVQLQVTFAPEKGSPLYSSADLVSLTDDAPPQITSTVTEPRAARKALPPQAARLP
jgi:hypothetical protein